MKASAFAPAKVNLTLHVTGQRPDGYHLLDSLVVFADVGDRVHVTHADAMSLTINGPMAEGVPADARNLVWKAADLAGVNARIILEKHLPTAAGIGGGSSDAAAALTGLARLSGKSVSEVSAAALGADVPVCLRAAATRIRGIGDILEPVNALPPLHAVLVNPGVALSTPSVFDALTRKQNEAMQPRPDNPMDFDTFVGWLAVQRNDLQAPAAALAPEINEVIQSLEGSLACALARMSGAGATCFGLYRDQVSALNAATAIKAQHPVWWVKPTTLS